MTPLFKKLNFKHQTNCLVLFSPDSFNNELIEMQSFTRIHKDSYNLEIIEFALIFVTQKATIEETMIHIESKLADDVVLWFCYPKGSSKKYSCDFNRDNGWDALGVFQFEPVRMVAIDEDWSALRFRKVDFIKKMTRNENSILSESGKLKSKKS
jgi:hypothetical protein